MASERKQYLAKVKRIIVKIGSSLLTDPTGKNINVQFLENLASQVKNFHKKEFQCGIVTSGAIAAGMVELGMALRPKEMSKLQALAAVGQSSLMHAYEMTFKKFGLKVAQILLTREDLSSPSRYSNARNTFKELFKHGIIPVVNENDTVAVEEIRFGDNDTLGVMVSQLCEADLLILLTDTDGFYNEDPNLNPQAELIRNVFKLDSKLEKKANPTNSAIGTGGMKTKIKAAHAMMKSGTAMVIANGRSDLVLKRILRAENIGTFFHPAADKTQN